MDGYFIIDDHSGISSSYVLLPPSPPLLFLVVLIIQIKMIFFCYVFERV
jgi:hypothetical protein